VRRNRNPRWVTVGAVGALAAYATLGTRLTAAAHAADLADPTTGSQAGHSQRPVRRFDIPAGPLDAAVSAFQTLTGIKVLALAPNETLHALQSPGAVGDFTPEQALGKILSGTGVRSRFGGDESVTLELRSRSESVVVTASIASSSPKYSEPLRDIPQTIAVIPKSVIEEQGATTLRDVLQNVPGLTIQAGEGGTPAGDNLTLRGFSARNDIFVDGVRDLGPQSRDPFNLEQVEVAKGPQSAYYGRGSTGGTINLVSKAPVLAPQYGVTLAAGTDSTLRFTGDVNRQVGESAAFRLNVLGHDADVAGRDVVQNQRWGVAPSLSLGLGTATRLTASYFHLSQDNLSDYGIPWVPATNNALAAYRDRPAPVPRDTFYGFASRDHENLDSDLGTLRLEHDWSDRVRVRAQLRYGHSTRDSIATPPRFASNDSTVINRELRSWITEDDVWSNQNDLTLRFGTGAVDHTMVTGIELSHEGNLRTVRTAPNSPTTLLDPKPDDVYTGVITVSPFVGDVTGKSAAAYAFDTARLGERWELSGGLRFDYFDVDGVTTVPAPVSRVDQMLSGRAGLVYKPRPNGSVYGSYGTSLNPSLEGLSYSTANTQIEPEKTRSYELGTKWDFAHERLALTAALFRVDKTNARTPGLTPDDPPQVLDGEQRVDGIELGATGALTHAWNVFAAYTHLDSEIRESNTPAEVGKHLVNTPGDALSVWTTYAFSGRIQLGGGARYIGRRYGNTTNTRFVDSYWLVDAMASARVTRKLSLRVNVYNLTDREYFDRLGGGHLVPGTARSALLSTSIDF
jgi:catecholate siderophore receptor